MPDQQTDVDPLKLTWDFLREWAQKQKDLSANQKQESVRAYDTLERVLGDSVLATDHPLFFFLYDHSSWRCEWAIWFADFLKLLSPHPDFLSLVHELQVPTSFGERMTVLEIVEILQSFGFKIRLDRPVTINNRHKHPDILLQLDDADPGFYIEVTRIGISEQEREANEAFHEIWGLHFFLWPLERCSGFLERTPNSLEIQQINQQLQSTVDKVKAGSEFEILDIPGLLKFACTREANDHRLIEWAAAHGIKAPALGMAKPQVDEFKRISNRLREKTQQVPNDRSNVIAVFPQLFVLPPQDSTEFEAFVKVLEDALHKFPQIGYLILILSWTGGVDNKVIRFRDHICVNSRWLYFNCSSTMLIKNTRAAKPFSPMVEQKFIAAFLKNAEQGGQFSAAG